MSEERARPVRADYRVFRTITTRWMDNDVYAHINNVVYYSFFDTIVNGFLVEKGMLDFERGDPIGLVVETRCRYFAPVAFPDTICGGLRVDHLGTSSVRYGIGIFREGEAQASAAGHFVHVYVGRETRRPETLPPELRMLLAAIQ